VTARPPRIGIVTYGHSKDPSRYSVPVEYVQAVRRSGARVVCVPPGDSPDALLDIADGLLLVGGGDINPQRYGADRHQHVYGVDDERDATELEMVAATLAAGKPILAICRGLQIINVALGGTLHQHLPDVVGESVTHRTCDGGQAAHDVRIERVSLLGEVLACERAPVASYHHQAIEKLGRGVVPCAWADDEVIEAVTLEAHPEVLAVQWHPEITAAADERQQGLFGWLARVAGK
jgi:putative glutamine amidotransferase